MVASDFMLCPARAGGGFPLVSDAKVIAEIGSEDIRGMAMNRRVLGGALSIVALIFGAYGQAVAQVVETTLSTGDLQTIRLHFTTFSKSKSGAT